MIENVGFVDKIIRIIIALALFSSYFILEGNLRYLSAIGLIPLVTGFVSWCPLYAIFGLNSCPMQKAS